MSNRNSSAGNASGSSTFEVEVTTTDGYQCRLDISVAASEVARVRKREVDRLRRTTRIKGFRKGRVPLNMIEERFGPTINEQSINKIVRSGLNFALNENDLRMLGEPVISDLDFGPGRAATFRADFEIVPEIELSRTTGFYLTRRAVEVENADVERALDEVRDRNATLSPVERRPGAGDVVSVAIRPDSPEAASAADASDPEPYQFELGKGQAIPDIESAIQSLEPGTESYFDVTYPTDFAGELAGTTQRLSIRLDGVSEKKLPDLDDAFASAVGGFDTLDDLRSVIEEQLRQRGEEEADKEVRERLVDQIIEANPFAVPPTLVSNYFENLGLENDPGITPMIERDIKRNLILGHIIKHEQLEVSRDEVDGELSRLASSQGITPLEARRQLVKESKMDSFRRGLETRKAFEFLLGQSEVANA